MFKVMVVEDEPVVLSNIGEILGMMGFDCVLAFDGIKALKTLELCLQNGEELPGLIVSDLMMPNMDGFGLLKEVKSDDRLRSIPFVILSAQSDSSDLKQAFVLGAEDYLVKPFDVEDLLNLAHRFSSRAKHGKAGPLAPNQPTWVQNDLFESVTQPHSEH